MKKYTIPFALILLFLVCMGPANAADTQNITLEQKIPLNTSINQNTTLNETVEWSEDVTTDFYVDSLHGNDTWDGKSPTYIGGFNGPFRTINWGVAIINSNGGGTLHLATGTYETLEMELNHNLNIYGENKDNTIISGMNENRIFYINENINITLAHLTLTNGKGTRSGGAIYNKGNLIIEDCNLYNNHAGDGNDADITHAAENGGNGGAICNIGNLTIKNSILHHNYGGNGGDATEIHSPGIGGHGGGIYTTGTVNIENSLLYNNIAGTGGKGALHNEKGGTGGHGGAIYNEGTLTITGTSTNPIPIYNNIAGAGGTPYDTNSDGGSGGSGGAIYNKNKCNITYAHIYSNEAGDGSSNTGGYDVDGGSGGSGGAIYNTEILNLSDCNIHDNSAGDGHKGHNGGDGGDGGSGGAIYNTGTFEVINCQIINNNAGMGGEAADGFIDNNVSKTCNAGDGGIGGSGGAIYNTGTITSITNSTINSNTAGNGGNGGEGSAVNVQHEHDEIEINDPGDGGIGGFGGAIYNTGTITSITNSTINSNTAGNGGDGGLYTDQINLNSMYDVNPAIPGIGGSGGGIYSTGTLNSLENTIIDDNSAGKGGDGNSISRFPAEDGGDGGNGGGLVIYHQIQTINCQISNNKAGNGGNGGNTNIPNTNPSTKPGNGGNAGSGGGIYVYYDNSKSQSPETIGISNNTLNNNSAGNGGAGGIDNTSYSNASNGGAGGTGGAISIVSAKISYTPNYNLQMNLEESNIYNNHAGAGGQSSLSGFSLNGVGGAIYSNDNHYFIVHFCRILNNTPQPVYLNLSCSNPYTDFQDNWWGSNSEPTGQITGNYIESSYYKPWIVLTINNSTSVGVNQNLTITANLIMNSNGENTLSDGEMHVPDGIPVTYTTDSGQLNPTNASIISGFSSTVFTAGSIPQVADVSATIDDQTVHTSVESYSARIEVDKTITTPICCAGSTGTMRIHVRNKGPETACNVVIKIPFPRGLEYISANTIKGTYTYDPSLKTLIWNLGDVPLGDYYLYLNLKALNPGKYIINSEISSNTNIQSIITPLNIEVLPANSNTNETRLPNMNETVGMQNTGGSIYALILAILAIFAGLIIARYVLKK